MDKKHLSESDICDKFIRPAMEAAGWNGMDQIYREFPLRAGRVVVRGQKAYRDKTTVVRADYALFHKPNIPLAVVEAKDNSQAMGAGMAQAINYAGLLGVPFSFSSNGDGFVFRDATMATGTGTGKTTTAFQIIWRLWKSGAKKRILFLADRNILIDQTMVNDFRPFKGAMAKLSPNAKGVERVDAQGTVSVEDVTLAVNKTTKQVDKSYEIYLSLYQAVSGTEEADSTHHSDTRKYRADVQRRHRREAAFSIRPMGRQLQDRKS